MPFLNPGAGVVTTRAHVHFVVTEHGVADLYGKNLRQRALALGLRGYARNLDDGGVEVLACGEPDQVEKLIAWLKAGGPRSARVDRVLTEPHQPTREWQKFAILY